MYFHLYYLAEKKLNFFPAKASDCGNLSWLGKTKNHFYRDWYTLLTS